MKRSLIFLLIIVISIGITQSQTSQNLIINGDFKKSSCKSQWCIFKTNGSVEGWIPDPEIEIGDGDVYSDFIKNEKVVELAPNQNGCIQQDIKNIPPGTYGLRFDHAARKSRTFQDCQFSVFFNGKLLKEFKHKNYTVQREKIDINIDKSTNASLRFCSFGGSDNSFGAIVKNVSLIQDFADSLATQTAQSVPQQNPTLTVQGLNSGVNPASQKSEISSDYVINGDFVETTCTKEWCIFKSSEGVKGWTPEPEIEIGNGEVYSDYVKGEKVLELTPNTNGCVSQMMNEVPSGIFSLQFYHAARKRTAFEDCMFSVYLNGKLLKEYKHTSYLINSETIDVKLGEFGRYNLKFCSNGGQNNGLGAILKNVSFVQLLKPTPAQEADSIPIPQLDEIVPLNSQVLGQPELSPLQPLAASSGIATFLGKLPLSTLTDPISPMPQNPTVVPIPNPSQQTLTLHSHSETCLQRSFNLEGGDITITFDYDLISNNKVKQSTTFVTVNGKPIYKALPCDNGNSLKIEGSLPKGSHVIGFCPAGSHADQPHEISLSKVILTQRPSVLSQ